MSQLYELARPFPKDLIKSAPAGKFGDYVKHSTVNERLLSIVGPFTYEIAQVLHGPTPEVKGTNTTWPGRDHAVVGCVGRLTVIIDKQQVTVEEVGDVEQAAMNEDGRNLKDASSDAFKRCAMRLGLGLHLWSGPDYFLDKQLEKEEDSDGEQAAEASGSVEPETLDLDS